MGRPDSEWTETISPDAGGRARREHDREARSMKVRRERLEARVGFAKKMKAISADPQWAKKRAAAVAGVAVAQREFDAANAPFERLKNAQAALFNAQARPQQVEGELRAAIIPLEREVARAEDYLWSDICGELQNALDYAMNSRAEQSANAREVLKAALTTAAALPNRFQGSFAKWESLLAQLRQLAHSRGTEMADSAQWDSESVFEVCELDGAGR